jgi:putative hydrolase of the HAD superfamily
MKRALILDLDNTIYPVSSIAENLFDQLFSLLDEHARGFSEDDFIAAKDDLTRRHFHLVADKYNFSPELKSAGINLLSELTYTLPMKPFDEYHYIKSSLLTKFLVTTGFTKLQWSKVKMLDIEGDFAEIHIVDPEKSTQTKKDVFAAIMEKHNYQPGEVLVIGDDPESEIKAARELGIETFLFDPDDKHENAFVTYKARKLKEVVTILF